MRPAAWPKTRKPRDCRVFLNSGGGIRTRDLRVMSPTSYLTAPPRGVTNECSEPFAAASTGGRGLAGCRQDLVGRSVVARVLGHVAPGDLAARGDHHRSSELGGVADDPALVDLAARFEGLSQALRHALRAEQLA